MTGSLPPLVWAVALVVATALVTTVRERLGSSPSVVALFAAVTGKPVVIVATNQSARDAGIRAGVLVRVAAGVLGGGGGGKDDLAQGGGVDIGSIPAAREAIASAAAA